MGLSKIPMFHDRSKKIEIWCHFLQDIVQKGAVALEYVPIVKEKFEMLKEILGFMEKTFLASGSVKLFTLSCLTNVLTMMAQQ